MQRGTLTSKLVRPLLAAVALAVASSAVLGGQSAPARSDARSLAGTDNVKAFIAARMQKNWTAPKTPWGDPDISGVFTKKDETNTPMERPREWAGRRMDDITPQEFADAVQRRQEVALERGAPRVVPIHWFDHLAARNSRPWFVIDPTEGKIPPRVPGAPPEEASRRENFQDVGQLAQSEVDAADALQDNAPKDLMINRTFSDRCIVFSAGLWQMPNVYGNSYQILQTPDHVVIRYEMVPEARMIPLDGRRIPTRTVIGYFGISRGWWEGHTLVVETTNIHDALKHRGASAKNLRLVERFTRISPRQVEWTVTVDDPTVYTRPWTYSMPMTEDNTQMIFEYACHEGNFGMANLLTAGRLLDKQQQEKRGESGR